MFAIFLHQKACAAIVCHCFACNESVACYCFNHFGKRVFVCHSEKRVIQFALPDAAFAPSTAHSELIQPPVDTVNISFRLIRIRIRIRIAIRPPAARKFNIPAEDNVNQRYVGVDVISHFVVEAHQGSFAE